MKKTFPAITFILGFLGFCLLGGCASTIPFTNEIVAEIGEDSITSFQYYLSEGILLTSEESSGSSTVSGGQAVIARSKQRDEIVIYPNTPCVVVERLPVVVMSDDETEEEFWWYALKVGFERLDDGSMPTLDFITAVNPPDDTKYWLSSFLNSDDAPVVTYNEKEYRVTRLDGSRLRQGTNGPYLNIKIQTSDRQSKSRRRVTGVKVNG